MKEFLNCINLGQEIELRDDYKIRKCKLELLKVKWKSDGHINNNFYGHVCIYTNNEPDVLSRHWECLSFENSFISKMEKALDKTKKI